jgi:hypothetical protein
VLVGPDLQEQVEVLGEQGVVVLEAVAEQGERVDERAAADDHLGAAFGEKVEGGELLEGPYGVDGAQDRHGAREADALGPGGSGPQDHGRRRVEEVLAVVLADAEGVEADLVGALDLGDEIAQPLRRVLGLAVLREGGGEAVDADLHVRPPGAGRA